VAKSGSKGRGLYESKKTRKRGNFAGNLEFFDTPNPLRGIEG